VTSSSEDVPVLFELEKDLFFGVSPKMVVTIVGKDIVHIYNK